METLARANRRAVLGNIAKQTLYDWRDHPQSARLSDDQLDRISYLLGIHKALHILFTRPEQADSWIRRPNEATPFGGKPAADLIFSGRMEDLMRVRRFLDGELAGGSDLLGRGLPNSLLAISVRRPLTYRWDGKQQRIIEIFERESLSEHDA